jgi:N-acetylmuramoyl-L-alanine amidase
MINEPKKIILHCSDSPHGRDDGAKEIHRWHLERGWDGIGYNYVIKEDGTIENGRPEYWIPAGAKGYNKDTLHICLIGINEFTDKQFQSLSILLRDIMLRYDIKKKDILGHYQVSSKSCPNFNVQSFVATKMKG